MRVVFVLFLVFVSVFHVQSQTVPVRIVSYNLLNFPNGRTDCGSGNVNLPNRADTLRKIMQYLKPDILVGCEIQTAAGCDSVLNRSLNVFGTTHYQRAAFIPNGAGGDLNNMLFYNVSKLTLKEQRVISTYPRDINHYILYINDNTLSQHHDTCFVEVFMAHLKAGSSSADQADRAGQTATLRTILNGRPQGRHLFVCGDLNTYRSSETCYQNLVSGGSNYLRDPLNASGNWTSNSSFGYLHTQSPRTSGSTDCGVTGGLDDRFDHILVSQNVMNGANALSYVSNSYKTIGNDGSHYNQSILSGGNSQYPDSVVRALYYGSDHLPVKVDLLYTKPTNFGLNLTLTFSGGACTSGGTNVTVVPNLGQAPYTYQWDSNASSQTTATAQNLTGGAYCVTVTDALGTQDVVCFEVEHVDALVVDGFPGSDYGTCDGQAFVLVSGGAPPYTYLWNDSQNQATSTASNLCAGNYTCTITDQNGCSQVVSIVVYSEVNSIEERFAGTEFLLFPNPAADRITVKKRNTLDLGFVQVQVVSLSGEVLSEEMAQFSTSGELNISLEGIQSGVYFVRMTQGNVKSNHLFMKQ